MREIVEVVVEDGTGKPQGSVRGSPSCGSPLIKFNLYLALKGARGNQLKPRQQPFLLPWLVLL